MSKEKRFLITTALEVTWVEDQPILFLGEWCRLYSRKQRWSKMNALVQAYHWDDREKLFSDYIYLNSLYERLLLDLSSKLNQIHGVECSLRYWRIMVGPWLAYFIHILFDRWLSIENAINSYEITGTVMLNNEENLVPNDLNHFNDLFVGDMWNHLIYGEILCKLSSVPKVLINNHKDNNNSKSHNPKSSLRHRILSVYSGIFKYFARDDDAFIINPHLTKFNEILLNLKLGQIPFFWKSVKPVQVNLDWQQRNWTIPSQCLSEFEVFLLSMLPKQIPKVYLEGYQQLTEQIQDLPWPKSPKLIYSYDALWTDSVLISYVAEKVEKGAKLVYGQHGGVYGVAKFTFSEEHEIKVSDRYLSWGWSSDTKLSVIPTGISKVRKNIVRNYNYNKNLLLITMNSSRYTYRLCSESAINFCDYFENYFLFTSLIDNYISADMIVRLSSWDRGWEQSLRWSDRFPKVQLDCGVQGIYELMEKSRIVVQTYNSTGILETLALGIPTVLFCDFKITPLRETAIPYYNELKRVGIFHDTPESAAEHVNAIWIDVNAWWTNIEVQEVLAQFKKQYCYRPDNILDTIEATLSEVIAESTNKM